GQYASLACGGRSSSRSRRRSCDADAWRARCAVGGLLLNCPTPDTMYQLRDVDCWDGSLGVVGLGAGLPFYGVAPCAPHPGPP
ncbi:MAG TPA: hypothetical protein VM582_07025, partial [Candidatus Thermoplasmatota archaeon]|nr:hypothetical protein [Candidatus Thermoplasmatota archaeon]